MSSTVIEADVLAAPHSVSGAGWTMQGAERRRANYAFRCAECLSIRELYLRPSTRIPEFCSRSCAMSHSMRSPARRSASAKFAEDHAGWKANAVSVKGGRTRALRLYKVIGPCPCGAVKAERHHADGNTANNTLANIKVLCRRCHMREDGRLDAVRAQMSKIQPDGVAARRGRR